MAFQKISSNILQERIMQSKMNNYLEQNGIQESNILDK
jgi:hypothetical protein